MNKRVYKHIPIKNSQELLIMRENGRCLAQIFEELSSIIKAGCSTMDIDQFVEKSIRSKGGVPSFKGYGGFPGSTCTSMNDIVIHGIPNAKDVLKEGDIISVDIGFYRDGFHADSAKTFAIGEIPEKVVALLEDTKHALELALHVLRPGKTLFDIANTLQDFLDSKNYGIVRDFVGHGVGRDLHEAPQVPNWRQPGLSKIRLHAGMVLAIEPMVTLGSPDVFIEDDEWTVRTKDSSLSAHFEHTVAITPTGYEILTSL